MVNAVGPSMRMRGSGHIVNIGSISGELAAPANGAYAATKHAVEALSDALRREIGSFGVEVILIEPGEIRTSFAETAARGSSQVSARPDSPYAALYARLAAVTGAQRAHEQGPEVVARVVLDALRAPRPRARYAVAVPVVTRITAALTDRGRDIVMRRLFSLGSPGPASTAVPGGSERSAASDARMHLGANK